MSIDILCISIYSTYMILRSYSANAFFKYASFIIHFVLQPVYETCISFSMSTHDPSSYQPGSHRSHRAVGFACLSWTETTNGAPGWRDLPKFDLTCTRHCRFDEVFSSRIGRLVWFQKCFWNRLVAGKHTRTTVSFDDLDPWLYEICCNWWFVFAISELIRVHVPCQNRNL